MQYIIVDFEWNQATRAAGNMDPPYPLTGEIIQIGAVKLDAQRHIVDWFQLFIKPTYFRVMHPNVYELTGIGQEQLKAGMAFPQAMEVFHAWAQGTDFDPVYWFSWGFDDHQILKENLDVFELDTDWIEKWYDLQMFYRFQVDPTPNQTALKTAMEHFSLTPPEDLGEAHNACFDAYCAGMICAFLDMEAGIAASDRFLKEHPPKLPDFLTRTTVRHCTSLTTATQAGQKLPLTCPRCGSVLSGNRPWLADKKDGTSYMVLRHCTNNQCITRQGRSEYFVRLRLVHNISGAWQAVLYLYSASSTLVNRYVLQKKARDAFKRQQKKLEKVGDRSGQEELPVKHPPKKRKPWWRYKKRAQ